MKSLKQQVDYYLTVADYKVEAKLNKKQLALLHEVERHLNRAINFINSDSVAVCRKGKNNATTSLHFSRADGETRYDVDKHIGSDLTGLQDVKRLLGIFIKQAEGKDDSEG